MHQNAKNVDNNNYQCDLCKQEFATSKGIFNDKDRKLQYILKNVNTV